MEQDFEFIGDSKLKMTVMGQTVEATFRLDGSKVVDGGLCMGVHIPGQPGLMPFIIKLAPDGGPKLPYEENEGTEKLLICSPHAVDQVNGGHIEPQKFAGPGLVKYQRSVPRWKLEVYAMSSDDKLKAFLSTLKDGVPKPPPASSTV